MTGIIINNNEYQVNTGSTKIEYNSMGGESVGYSMYGEEVPYTEILKEYPLEYLKVTDTKKQFSFKYLSHGHLVNTHYKATLKASVPTDWSMFRIFEADRTKNLKEACDLDFKPQCSYGHAYRNAWGSGKYLNKTFFRTLDDYSSTVKNIPFDTKISVGWQGSKFYSNIGKTSYSEDVSVVDPNSYGYSFIDMSDVIPSAWIYGPIYFYGVEETYQNTVYKYLPFYNTETQKFYIKETTTNTIVCTLEPSDIDEYQIKA